MSEKEDGEEIVKIEESESDSSSEEYEQADIFI